jgi:hypothetical protein
MFINAFTPVFALGLVLIGSSSYASFDRNPPSGIPSECYKESPFQLDLSLVQLMYMVPTERLRPFVPSAYELVGFGGQSVLGVVTAHYTKAFSISTNIPGQPYDEVGYETEVLYHGKIGIYFIKLHLNSSQAVEVGRICYGYPKEYADVSYQDANNELDINVSSETEKSPRFRLVAKKSDNLMVRAFDQVLGESAAFFLRDSYFSRNGELLRAQSKVSGFNRDNIFSLDVDSIETPFLTEEGLLNSVEASKPMLAVLYDGLTLRLSAPEHLDQ